MFILMGLTVSLLAIFISLLGHELGHVVAGIRSGLCFNYLAVGPLKISSDSVKIKIHSSQTINEWCGLNFMTIPVKSKLTIRNYQRYIIGGVKASFMLTMISVFFVLLTMIYPNKMLLLFFLILFLSNLTILFVTYFPFKNRTGLYYTDGKRYKELKEESQIGKWDFYCWELTQNEIIKDSLISKEEKKTLIEELLHSNDIYYQTYGYYQSYIYSYMKKEEVFKSLSLLYKKSDNVSEKKYIKEIIQELT